MCITDGDESAKASLPQTGGPLTFVTTNRERPQECIGVTYGETATESDTCGDASGVTAGRDRRFL